MFYYNFSQAFDILRHSNRCDELSSRHYVLSGRLFCYPGCNVCTPDRSFSSVKAVVKSGVKDRNFVHCLKSCKNYSETDKNHKGYYMETVKFSDVSVFVVTLEVAIAVVSLFPLTIVFGVFALVAFEHEGPEPFYPEESKLLLIASAITFISIYVLQIIQLLTGIWLLKSITVMKINFVGTIKTSWIWLITSVLTASVLLYLIHRTAMESENNLLLLISLIVYLLQKLLSFGFVLRFTISACFIQSTLKDQVAIPRR